jgi:hypothetical protein
MILNAKDIYLGPEREGMLTWIELKSLSETASKTCIDYNTGGKISMMPHRKSLRMKPTSIAQSNKGSIEVRYVALRGRDLV